LKDKLHRPSKQFSNINAQQAKIAHAYKNMKGKVHRTNATIWCNS